jgi:hypothetical protein
MAKWRNSEMVKCEICWHRIQFFAMDFLVSLYKIKNIFTAKTQKTNP